MFFRHLIRVTWIALCLSVVYSCDNEHPQKKVKTTNQKPVSQTVVKEKASLKINSPQRGLVIKRNQNIDIEYSISENKNLVDSCVVYLNNKQLNNPQQTDSTLYKAGQNTLNIKVFQNNGLTHSETLKFNVVASQSPKKLKYEVVKTYPHNTQSYTQGLLYTKGILYEGTGQYSESTLQKIQIPNMEVIQSYKLPDEVFGEGIVLFKDHIYQLTWRSRKAFVYQVKDFNLVREFYYNTEGWGITNYNDQLIMSDGTQNLYILEPESFSVISNLQVYNHLGPINRLNELEWINGKIWANVYLTNTIVIIDPKTGFVESELDLSAIVPDTYANQDDNVLNGIAYNDDKQSILVTGKRWPTLFELKIKD